MAKTYKRRHAKTRRTRKHKTRKYKGGKPTPRLSALPAAPVKPRSKSRSPPPNYSPPSPPKYKPRPTYPGRFPKILSGSKPVPYNDQFIRIELRNGKELQANYVLDPDSQSILKIKNKKYRLTGQTFVPETIDLLEGNYNEGEVVLPFEESTTDPDIKIINLRTPGNHLVKV